MVVTRQSSNCQVAFSLHRFQEVPGQWIKVYLLSALNSPCDSGKEAYCVKTTDLRNEGLIFTSRGGWGVVLFCKPGFLFLLFSSPLALLSLINKFCRARL